MFLVNVEIGEYEFNDLMGLCIEGIQQAEVTWVGARVVWTAESASFFSMRRCEANTRTTW